MSHREARREVEGTVHTARVLLDEVTRIYRADFGEGAEEIRLLAESLLAKQGLRPTYHPTTHEFDITRSAYRTLEVAPGGDVQMGDAVAG